MVTLRVLNILMPFVWFSLLFDHFCGPFSFLFFQFFNLFIAQIAAEANDPGSGG